MFDILSESGMLGCTAVDTLRKANVKSLSDQGELVDDPDRYHRLVGKLNYLTSRLDIAFVMSIVS